MRFNLDAIIGKNNYSGKKSEELSEKKEKEEYAFNNTESKSDYNKIKEVEAGNAVHSDNKYNSVEEEEKISQPENRYVAAEDVVDEDSNEEKLLESIDEQLATERAAVKKAKEDETDAYGIMPIKDRLIATAEKKEDEIEVARIKKAFTSFRGVYENLLAQKLPVDQEEKAVRELFKTYCGELVYSGDDVELLSMADTLIKNAPKNHWRGEKVAPAKKDQIDSWLKPTLKSKLELKENIAPDGRFTVKKGGNKWPGTDILKKIKIKY